MYLTLGSGIPDAVFKRVFGTDFFMMLVICATLDCANKDMDDPESSITSKVECPMFPITAVCILVVATTTVCVGLSLNRDADCPSGTSLSHFPTASSWQQCGLACHRCNTYTLCFYLDNIIVCDPTAYSSNTVAGSYHSSGLPSVLPLVLSILEFGILVLNFRSV